MFNLNQARVFKTADLGAAAIAYGKLCRLCLKNKVTHTVMTRQNVEQLCAECANDLAAAGKIIIEDKLPEST